jgi:hypothetical protein
LKTLGAGSNRVFVGTIHMRGRARLKATEGNVSSLVAPEFRVTGKKK